MAHRFKCDENLPRTLSEFFVGHGFDAMSVQQQQMSGIADRDLLQVCVRESRVLVTLDLDFSDITTYPLEEHLGVIILRIRDQSRAAVLDVAAKLLPKLQAHESLDGQLWIVDGAKVRIRAASDDL